MSNAELVADFHRAVGDEPPTGPRLLLGHEDVGSRDGDGPASVGGEPLTAFRPGKGREA